MGSAFVCSKTVMPLFLIHWLFVFSLFDEGIVTGPCFAMHYIVAVGVRIVPEYGITPKTTNSNYESQNTI